MQVPDQVARQSWTSKACGTHVLSQGLLEMPQSQMTLFWDQKVRMGKLHDEIRTVLFIPFI